jgi:hypothetical protein
MAVQTEENEDQAQQADGTHLHVPQGGQAAPEQRHLVHSKTEEDEHQAQQADGTHLHVLQGGQAAHEHRHFVHSQTEEDEDQAQQADGTHLHVPQGGLAAPEQFQVRTINKMRRRSGRVRCSSKGCGVAQKGAA